MKFQSSIRAAAVEGSTVEVQILGVLGELPNYNHRDWTTEKWPFIPAAAVSSVSTVTSHCTAFTVRRYGDGCKARYGEA